LGKLFRSGQHCDATSEDLALVSQIGLATVVDLRSDSERAQYPCARPEDFQGDVLFASGNTLGASSHLDAAKGVRTAADAHQAMVELYRAMPFRPVLQQSYRLYFQRLAELDSPSLIHCLAGKDRTGLAVALLHHQLGVHSDDIFEDYLLTNVAGNMERRIAAGADAVRANFGPDMEDDAVRTLMSVHPAFLDAALEEIGDVDRYCEEVLGITPAQQNKLRLGLTG
jgi:protein tyrosine/serine phosphatase